MRPKFGLKLNKDGYLREILRSTSKDVNTTIVLDRTAPISYKISTHFFLLPNLGVMSPQKGAHKKQHPRSSGYEASVRAEDGQGKPSLVPEIPDDRERRELPLRDVMDAIPGLVGSALPNGDVEFCNQRWLDYTGMGFNEIKGWGWAAAIHPQDMSDLRERWRIALIGATSFEAEARMRRAARDDTRVLFYAVDSSDSRRRG